ncbi:MAG: hypothetical protein K0Q55_1679 [Verrucomicrobia bacterium]|jgi:hypothetical protein|nr:hypothetical protein [Verrucomicrobiota bacterium]
MSLDWKTLENVCVGRHSRHIVGGFTLFPKDFWCEVVLWRKIPNGEEPRKDEKLAYRFEGWPFRDNREWKGKIAVDGNEAVFQGEGKKGEIRIGSASYQTELVFGWLRPPAIHFVYGGKRWVAMFPGALMTEGDRGDDEVVVFQGDQSVFELCVFPKERYIEHFNPYDQRPTAIAPETRAIVEEAGKLPVIGADFPLLCLTLGLLGFEIHG